MPKQPPWKIRIGRKVEIIGEFEVPSHKLDTNGVKSFLRALVARYRTERPEDMVAFYVNRRRGDPARSQLANVIKAWDFDRCLIGYSCGNWDCYADAMRRIGPEAAEFLREETERTKRNA